MVILPTPPGTGVIHETFGATLSKSTSPHSFPSTRLMPTSTTTALTGVGPSLAQEIITERERNGDFHYPEDLTNVKGIGAKKLEKMREQLLLP